MFEGFRTFDIQISDPQCTIHGVIGGSGPPLLLIHGDEDETVPTEQSVMLDASMRKAGNNNVRLIILKDEAHQWSPMTVANRQIVLGESLKFFQQNLGPGIGAQ